MYVAPVFLIAVAASLSAQDTVRFTPTVGHPTFAVREPVVHITPGTVAAACTLPVRPEPAVPAAQARRTLTISRRHPSPTSFSAVRLVSG